MITIGAAAFRKERVEAISICNSSLAAQPQIQSEIISEENVGVQGLLWSIQFFSGQKMYFYTRSETFAEIKERIFSSDSAPTIQIIPPASQHHQDSFSVPQQHHQMESFSVPHQQHHHIESFSVPHQHHHQENISIPAPVVHVSHAPKIQPKPIKPIKFIDSNIKMDQRGIILSTDDHEEYSMEDLRKISKLGKQKK